MSARISTILGIHQAMVRAKRRADA
jgi:hypothetical protein